MARAVLPPLPTVETADDAPDTGLLLPVEGSTAKQINASRPFFTGKLDMARPFKSGMSLADRERATACLAIAAIYEAGGNADDQRPVMQTILNRARHPAFPGSVCGVVFQGQERRTGCQFTFTCDGSMARYKPGEATFAKARQLAGMMLSGLVDTRVGLATHYHTDWVVPYWSKNLDKVAAVKTHLFFRWRGYWGTPRAFAQASAGEEPVIRALAPYSSAHDETEDLEVDAPLEDVLPSESGSSEPGSVFTAARADEPARVPTLTPLVSRLDSEMQPGRWALRALALCGQRPVCRVVAWKDPNRIPATLDQSSLSASPPDLLFVQTLRERKQILHINCAQWDQQLGAARCLTSAAATAALATTP
ncbi:MAG: cell wall hydrolase [Erythrobacter sp.]